MHLKKLKRKLTLFNSLVAAHADSVAASTSKSCYKKTAAWFEGASSYWTCSVAVISHRNLRGKSFRQSNLTGRTAWGRKRLGIRATLIQLVLRLLLADVRSQEKERDKWDSGCQTTWDQRLSDRAVAPDGWTVSQDYSWTRRGGLCVYNIDAWCSHTVKEDAQCLPDWTYTIAIILLLRTIPLMQIQLMHYLSTCICI